MSISVMINNENFKLLQIKNKLRVTYRVIGFLPVDIDCSVIGLFFPINIIVIEILPVDSYSIVTGVGSSS